jgi:hypothetical protein
MAKMRIVITGGAGAISQTLTKKIKEGSDHQVIWIDQFIHDFHEAVPDEKKEYDISNMPQLWAYEIKPDIIIHLAEENNFSRRGIQSYESTLLSNIIGTTKILNWCFQSNTKCIIGTWLENVPNSNIVTSSINFRRRLIDFYGTGIVKKIKIPRIISSYISPGTYGAWVSRILNTITNNSLFIVEEDENPIWHRDEIPIPWTSVTEIANELFRYINNLSKCQFTKFNEPRIVKITFTKLMENVIDIFGIDKIHIYSSREDPYSITSNVTDSKEINLLRSWVQEEFGNAIKENTSS